MNIRIVKELHRLAAANHGLLLPEQVVQAAKHPSSVLHRRFEWNNTKAAAQYRLWQARQLISVSVQVLPGSQEPVHVFMSLRSDRGSGGYRTTVSILSDAEQRQQLLDDALMELNLFNRKYATLRELAGVFAAARKVRRRAA